jgi:hypothetical protein
MKVILPPSSALLLLVLIYLFWHFLFGCSFNFLNNTYFKLYKELFTKVHVFDITQYHHRRWWLNVTRHSGVLLSIPSGVGLGPLYCGHFWPIVPAPDDRWGWLWSNWWNEDWQGKPKYSEKTGPSATLSTTNPTWPDPGSNPGRRGGKPATNRLSYGANHFWSVT